MDDSRLTPAEVLVELARLLDGLRGGAVLRLERAGAEHRWYIYGGSAPGPTLQVCELISAASQATPAAPGGSLCEIERHILQVACEHSEQALTGEQLAKLTEYPLDARFRRALSHLRQLHFLSGKTGDVGYCATQEGHDYLRVTGA